VIEHLRVIDGAARAQIGAADSERGVGKRGAGLKRKRGDDE
jgi:hypothetical protein